MITFNAFPKIPRYRREVCITEKIDGTNACIQIRPMIECSEGSPMPIFEAPIDGVHHGIWPQSRNGFIRPDKDNFGFAKWVQDNAWELIRLGSGAHFGEWWGQGVQRGYGQTRKRFSLFNVARWQPGRDTPPACCDVVPILAYCSPEDIQVHLEALRLNGSSAAPGFMSPEGIVVWHSQSKQYYKILLENDEIPKSVAK